ncbi:cyclin N-terminal domain-containing protein 1-like [Sycon ciliatum]|uniref:cyclin N-terminal domain-containing protein 1-like n=1 Tax=Sycon ciliatum TaxID=27933 RepID=UPI0031F68235
MPANSESKIFGSPQEPLFNQKTSGLSAELLEDALHVLAENNEKNKLKAPVGRGLFKSGAVAEYVFLLCEHLELPNEARYLAVELFDRFMAKHVAQLYEHVMNSDKYPQKEEGWATVESRIQRQLTLRMASCIQLASKMCSHYKIAAVSKLRQFLRCLGLRYADDALSKSELRILETLEFTLSIPSPLTYVETILEILGHNSKKCRVKLLHGTSLLVLDMIYLNFEDIYGEISKTMAAAEQRGTPMAITSTRCLHSASALRSDLMLLAVIVTGTAAVLVDVETSSHVMQQIALITQMPKESLRVLVKILLNCIIKSDKALAATAAS